jgi:hypothetical protein
MMTAIAVVLAALGQTAAADELAIAVDREVVVAPAMVTVTASVTSEDPIVSYRWSGLPNAPRCREPSCVLDLQVSSCIAVELEAVTAFGDTLLATRAICAEDGRGGRPPSLELSFDLSAPEAVSAFVDLTPGTDSLALLRVWVDGVEELVTPPSFTFAKETGCRAIDAFAADREGRIAIAQKTLCFDRAAPQLWLGGSPAAFRPAGERIAVCSEAAHPLELPITSTEGQVPLGECGAAEEAPRALRLVVAGAADSRGLETTATAFLAATPASGAPVLMFAAMPRDLAATSGKAARFEIEIYGGQPPFTLVGFAGVDPIEVSFQGPRSITASFTAFGTPIGDSPVSVTIRDERGLEVSLSATVHVAADVGPDPSAAFGESAACVCTRGGAPSASIVLFALFALFLAARGGRR